MKVGASTHPSVVLGPVLETLVRGRRVAVLGDATLGLGERLAARGARLVHAYDPSPARTAEAIARTGATGPGPKPVAFAVLEGDLGVRDGAFDVVVVPDLSSFPDAGEILRRARRLLPTSGLLIAAIPNQGAARTLLAPERQGANPLDYYPFYDAVALQFPVVRMFGQAPFVGYSVVDFAPEGEVDVSVDTSLLESTEEPEWFIAVAGERPAQLDPFTVVELAFEDVAQATGRASSDAAPASSVLALTEAQTRASMLATELERMRDSQRAASERQSGALAALSTRIAELEGEVDSKSQKLRELDGRAGDAHVRAEQLTRDLRDLDEELRRQRERAARLTKQLDDEKRARTKADIELGLARGAAETPSSTDRARALASELDVARARIAELEIECDREEVTPTRIIMRPSPTPEEQARRVALERERDEARARAEALTSRLHAAELRLTQANAARDEALARASERETEVETLRADCAALESRASELAQAPAAPTEDPNASADVMRLEDLLRERGQVIAALKRELRESERIGRELVGELETAQSAPPSPGRAADTDPGLILDLTSRLDALAQTAASCEADLVAARWRVAQLEHELLDARADAASSLHDDLEAALLLAQEELAAPETP